MDYARRQKIASLTLAIVNADSGLEKQAVSFGLPTLGINAAGNVANWLTEKVKGRAIASLPPEQQRLYELSKNPEFVKWISSDSGKKMVMEVEKDPTKLSKMGEMFDIVSNHKSMQGKGGELDPAKLKSGLDAYGTFGPMLNTMQPMLDWAKKNPYLATGLLTGAGGLMAGGLSGQGGMTPLMMMLLAGGAGAGGLYGYKQGWFGDKFAEDNPMVSFFGQPNAKPAAGNTGGTVNTTTAPAKSTTETGLVTPTNKITNTTTTTNNQQSQGGFSIVPADQQPIDINAGKSDANNLDGKVNWNNGAIPQKPPAATGVWNPQINTNTYKSPYAMG